MSFDAELGPVNYVVITFDSAPVPTGGLDHVVSLVETGRILVLDVEFVTKGADGSVSTVAGSDVGVDGFDGASALLIDEEDLAVVAEGLAPGGVAVVLVYEDLALLPALRAWAAEGAKVISEGPIVVDDLIQAIDASDEVR